MVGFLYVLGGLGGLFAMSQMRTSQTVASKWDGSDGEELIVKQTWLQSIFPNAPSPWPNTIYVQHWDYSCGRMDCGCHPAKPYEVAEFFETGMSIALAAEGNERFIAGLCQQYGFERVPHEFNMNGQTINMMELRKVVNS